MQKNKLLILLILFPMISQAAITEEQFMALTDDKKWEVYSEHISNYRRIFKNKDEEINRLEDLDATGQKWQNLAIGSLFISAASILIAAGTVYVAIKNPDALRR